MKAPSPVGQRCVNHPERESSARCMSCGRFYCRECVTEHDGRIICAACLAKAGEGGGDRRRALHALATPAALIAALVLAYAAFYTAGRALIALPSAFHEGAAAASDTSTYGMHEDTPRP